MLRPYPDPHRHPTSLPNPNVSNALHSPPKLLTARRERAPAGAVHVSCSSTAWRSAANTKSSGETRSVLLSLPVTQTSGRLFHFTVRSSGGRSNPVLAHTRRDALR